jgi:hypothetical protein
VGRRERTKLSTMEYSFRDTIAFAAVVVFVIWISVSSCIACCAEKDFIGRECEKVLRDRIYKPLTCCCLLLLVMAVILYKDDFSTPI